MNRKSFFKKIGLGLATIAVAPKLLEAQSTASKDDLDCIPKGAFTDTRKKRSDFKREYIRANTKGGLSCGSPIEIITKFPTLLYGDYIVIDSEYTELVGDTGDIATDEFAYMIYRGELTDEGVFSYTALPLHSHVRMKGEYTNIPIDITFNL